MVIGVVAMGILMATPFAGTMVRRSATLGAVSSVRTTLAAARLQSVKTGAVVVVVVSKNANNGIHLQTFRDKADLAATSANDGNMVQDTGEPTLAQMDVGSSVHLWKRGGTKDQLSTSAPFDGYAINGALDTSLTHRVVFLPTGGILLPQSSNSGTPQPVSPEGRGIYFADAAGKNFLRVTIVSSIASEARVDKYETGRGYVSSGWGWQ